MVSSGQQTTVYELQPATDNRARAAASNRQQGVGSRASNGQRSMSSSQQQTAEHGQQPALGNRAQLAATAVSRGCGEQPVTHNRV